VTSIIIGSSWHARAGWRGAGGPTGARRSGPYRPRGNPRRPGPSMPLRTGIAVGRRDRHLEVGADAGSETTLCGRADGLRGPAVARRQRPGARRGRRVTTWKRSCGCLSEYGTGVREVSLKHRASPAVIERATSPKASTPVAKRLEAPLLAMMFHLLEGTDRWRPLPMLRVGTRHSPE